MKKNISAILIGFWAMWMFVVNTHFGLNTGFGINIDYAFTGLATTYENSIVFFLYFISVALGVVMACYVKKDTYFISAIGTLIFCILPLLAFTFALIAKDSVPKWFYAACLGMMVVGIAGGVVGIFIFKYLKKSRNFYFGGGHYGLLDYFFAPKWRSFLTIIIFFTALEMLIRTLPDLASAVLWIFIAPFYVLLHPSVWTFLSMRGILIYILVTIALPIPFLLVYITYKIGIAQQSKLKKIIYIAMVVLGFYFGNIALVAYLNNMIMHKVTQYASKGNEVWPVLLNKYTDPLEKNILSNYMSGAGKVQEEKEFLERSIAGYLRLSKFALMAKNDELAQYASDKVLELSVDSKYIFDIGKMYYDFESYERAAKIFEEFIDKDPQNIDGYRYLLGCYDELDIPRDKVEQIVQKNLTADEKKQFLDYTTRFGNKSLIPRPKIVHPSIK